MLPVNSRNNLSLQRFSQEFIQKNTDGFSTLCYYPCFSYVEKKYESKYLLGPNALTFF